jgi:hypothetical protein
MIVISAHRQGFSFVGAIPACFCVVGFKNLPAPAVVDFHVAAHDVAPRGFEGVVVCISVWCESIGHEKVQGRGSADYIGSALQAIDPVGGNPVAVVGLVELRSRNRGRIPEAGLKAGVLQKLAYSSLKISKV